MLLVSCTVALIPVVYGAGLATGVPIAQGCSGSANVQTPGITSFNLWNVERTQPLALANDGFFAIGVSGNFANDEALLESLAVEVTDADRAPVSGRLHTFPSDHQTYSRTVYWLADAPLVDGAYTAVVSAPANEQLAEITQPLEVHGAPTPLTLASVEPSEWLEYHRLTGGNKLSCYPGGLCAPVHFAEIEESFPGVRVKVTAPAVNGQAYWEASLQRADGSDPSIDPIRAGSLDPTHKGFQRDLSFSKPLAEYCVVLKMIDRRDDRELSSPKICWKPGTPTVIDETNVVRGCPESPSPALLPLWCQGHAEAQACAGVGGDTNSPGQAGTAGSAGTTSHPESPRVAGSAANAPTPAGAQSNDASSSACSVGHARGGSSLGVAALLAFAVFVLRRSVRRSARGPLLAEQGDEDCPLLVGAKFKPRTLRDGGSSRRVGFTMVMILALCGADLALGVRSALACSPLPPGITAVRVVNGESTRPLAVANDGFFMIAVTGTFGEPAGALTQLAVEVKNAAGQVFAGSLQPLSGYMSWAADAPLVDGAYTAKVTVSTPAPGQPQPLEITQALEVQGAPTPLALASIEPSEWLEFRSLTGGAQLSCQAPGSCGPIQFGELEESSPGVRVRVTVPAINGQVYWQARVQSAGGGDAAPSSSFTGEGGGNELISELRFSQPLAEYCVELKMTDQRNGSELTSPKMCWKPESPTLVDESDIISSCPQSPSPALLARWCKHHQSDPACAGVASMGQGGSTGSGGTTGTGAAPGTAATAGSAGTAGIAGRTADSPPLAGTQPEDDAASSACSVGHSRLASGLGAFALLACAAFAWRRRIRSK